VGKGEKIKGRIEKNFLMKKAKSIILLFIYFIL